MLILVLSMVVPALVIGGCLYYLILTVMAERMLLPDIIARDLVPLVRRINLVILTVMPLIFALFLGLGLWLSRLVIAPLERLEEDLCLIDRGDYSVRLKIEQDHDLRPVADTINHLVDKLQKNGKGERGDDPSDSHS